MKKIFVFLLFFIVLSYNALALPFINVGANLGVRGGYTASGFSAKNYSGDSIKKADRYFGSAFFAVDVFSLRGELEYTFRPSFVKFGIDNRNSEIDYASQTTLGLYYKLLSLAVFDLYTGAFAGKNKIKGDFVKSYDNTVWGAGATLDISVLLVKFELGYRYVDMGEVVSKSNLKQDLKSHDVFVGLKFGI